MAGLLGSSKRAEAGKPSAKNPILTKTVTDLEAKIPASIRKNYDAIVVSGMRIMFDKKTHEQMVEMLKQSNDIVQNVASGVSMLIGVIVSEVPKKIRRDAAMLASVTLMTEALDYASKAMGVQITPDLVGKCTIAVKEAVMKLMKITPEMEQQAIAAGQQQGNAQQGAPQPQGVM